MRRSGKKIVLYGIGNACERISALLHERGLSPAAIFASDGFVRDRSFLGMSVESYAQVKERFGPDGMTVLLCFGTHRPEVLDHIMKLASETELLAPDIAVIPEYGPDGMEIIFDSGCMAEHSAELDEVRSMLSDEKSRIVFDKVLDYRLNGDIRSLRSCETPAEEAWLLSGISDGWSLLDLGAYTGDTAELFIRLLRGKTGRIAAVEPEERNMRRMREKFAENGDIRLIRAAAGISEGMAMFSSGGGRGSLQKKKKEVPVVTIDGLCGITGIEPSGVNELLTMDYLSLAANGEDHYPFSPDLIKFDIEGSELAAIKGGERYIRHIAPSMIVSAYHRVYDMWEIPLAVKGLRPDYKVFLRRSPCVPNWDLQYIFRL